jgi:predicted ATPase
MIKSVEIRNFKAIKRTKVKLTPLTAFIGYNGAGKSSVLEALETFRTIVTEGLDAAIRPWREFEHIYYKGKKPKRQFQKDGIKFLFSPMEFSFEMAKLKNDSLSSIKFSSSIAQEASGSGSIYFISEYLKNGYVERIRDADNFVDIDFYISGMDEKRRRLDSYDKSILGGEDDLRRFLESWQFLSMNTFLMGEPQAQKKTIGGIQLQKDGRNIAEYLLSIRDADLQVYEGILETLQYILPYSKDLQPQITQELEKRVYLQLSEQDFKLPGWVLSTGTLKVLALLAVFRNPNPSPLIVIEEIENGLDPRTISIIVSEIREFVKNKNSQVIVTTHSPYLLDLLHLSQIVFVERRDGNVVFNRPYHFEQLRNWSKEYTPGELYTKDIIKQIIK